MEVTIKSENSSVERDLKDHVIQKEVSSMFVSGAVCGKADSQGGPTAWSSWQPDNGNDTKRNDPLRVTDRG